jgi:hypothetical protein
VAYVVEMSWSSSCLLPWQQIDVERVRAAIETALSDCAKQWPEYANARIEVAGSSIHVFYPAALVERPHWEIDRPSGAGPDGYPCTYRHFWIDAMPEYDMPGECIVSLDSNTSANREAWMTASKVLDRITELLGGTSRDF